MKTETKRKIINLDESTFKTLSIMAIENGTNLKNYIEHLLSDIADNYEDARLYAKLSKERPEGHVMLNEQEKAEFEEYFIESNQSSNTCFSLMNSSLNLQRVNNCCFPKTVRLRTSVSSAGHGPVPCPVQRLTALYTQLFCGLLCNANAVCMNSLTASATFGLSLRIINAAKLSIPSSSFIQTVCME